MSICSSAFPFRRHAVALALALATAPATAVTINVNGACTLVNAINNANSDSDIDGSGGCAAGSGADTLELKANDVYTLTAVDNFTDGANGLPSVTSVITINGNGATIKRSGDTSIPGFRLLHIGTLANLSITNLKLAGGYFKPASGYFDSVNYTHQINDNPDCKQTVDCYGGGIFNRGTLTISNTAISGNTALIGGGINNEGKMKISNSTISDNFASYSGGGINNSTGHAKLTHSTISGNLTGHQDGCRGGCSLEVAYGFGGGIANAGSFTLVNATISSNESVSSAGGIGNTGNLTVLNSTIALNSIWQNGDNYQTTGGGINNSGNLTLTNSLIAYSSGEYVDAEDCTSSSPVTFKGVNLIEDGSCGAPMRGDPKLRKLLDNGGPTLTQAIKGTSPANAAADTTLCPTNDQRNIRRAWFCDLGAFERKAMSSKSLLPLVKLFDNLIANGGLSITVAEKKEDYRVALRNQLLTAGNYRDRNLSTGSCAQLTRTLRYIDADNTPEPDDYVTGSSGGLLAKEIKALLSGWACS